MFPGGRPGIGVEWEEVIFSCWAFGPGPQQP